MSFERVKELYEKSLAPPDKRILPSTFKTWSEDMKFTLALREAYPAILKRLEALEGVAETARKVASALDEAGGDTDPPGDPETEWEEDHPDLYACYILNKALSALDSAPKE